MFTRVVEAASGYDIVGNWSKFCVGDPIEDVIVKKRGVILRFMIASPGRLKGIHGLKGVEKMDGIEAGSFYKKGENVPEFKNDGTRTGWMITTGKDRSEALKKADIVSRTVRFDTEILA